MNAWSVFGLAFLAVAAVTPVVRVVAIRLDFVDRPTSDRFHARVVALGGGVGLVLGLLVILWLAGMAAAPGGPWLLGGLLAIAALGLVDDARGLPPAIKAAGQFAIAVSLALGGGLLPTALLTSWHAAWVLPLAVLWIVGVVNASNFLDNMDGMLAGIATVSAVGYWVTGDAAAAPLAPALAGAALGFLVHNFPPARLFMGDVGSMSLGYLLAALSLRSLAAGVGTTGAPHDVDLPARLLGTALVLGYPLLDVTFVTVTRLRRGQPVYQGGCDHTTHRLHRVLGEPRRTALAVYLVAMISAAIGVILLRQPESPVWMGVITAALLAVLALGLARVPAR